MPSNRRAMTRAIPTAAIAITLVLGGCSAAPHASTAPSAGTPIPVPGSASPAPSAPPSNLMPSAPPTSAPSATPSSLPSVAMAPAGPWSAIHWVSIGALPLGPAETGVYGWSNGFIAFEQSPGSDDNGNDLPVKIRVSSSRDGVTWTTPTTLVTGFKGMIHISTIVEGPDGLLALAYHYGDTCGGPEPVAAIWSTGDGRTWDRLPLPKAFTTGGVQTMAGGPAGYIARGLQSDHATPAIWTSTTGRSWTGRPLPTLSSGRLVLDDVASISDGFLLVGAVEGEGGCGGAAHIRPAIWFSTNGASWTRTSLPGALTDPNTSLSVERFNDHVLAIQYPSQGDQAPAWSSSDGRTWTPVSPVPTNVQWAARSDGRHSVMTIEPDSGTGPLTLIAVDERGGSTTLGQTGDVPTDSVDGPGSICAVGPTGILLARPDGSASWLGIPS